MSTPTAARRGHPGDAGSVTLFLVISVIGLLAMVRLVVDGAGKVRAVQRADALAAEAGRAGGQAIDAPASILGEPPVVDARAAVAAAQAYLARNGIQGGSTRVLASFFFGGRPIVLMACASAVEADIEAQRSASSPWLRSL